MDRIIIFLAVLVARLFAAISETLMTVIGQNKEVVADILSRINQIAHKYWHLFDSNVDKELIRIRGEFTNEKLVFLNESADWFMEELEKQEHIP